MSTLDRHRLEGRSWTEVEALVRGSEPVVAFFPIGSTEAHGPHLPLATDALISERMCLEAADLLEREGSARAVVLPTLPYAVTDFSNDFAGTITVSSETARAMMRDVGRSVLSQGIDVLVFGNSHLEPAHIQGIAAVASELDAAFPGRVAFPDKTRRPWALELGDEFRSGACHAGEYESSLVLAHRPDWVREDVRGGLEAVPISLSEAIRAGVRTFREAGSDAAYFGDPRRAHATAGEEWFGVLARMLAQSARERLDSLSH